MVFLVIWDWTWHQDAMPGCAENEINTMVFRQIFSFGKVRVLGVPGEALSVILGGFG